MAINFPHNPNINDIHTEASLGKSWKWDGTSWLIYSSTTTGIAFGDLSVSQQAASGTGTLNYNNAGVFTYTPPALTTTFIGLNDTPNALTSNKWLKVNSQGTALEWTDAPSGGGGSGATYDLTADDGIIATEEKILLTGSDSSEDAVTLAVDANSGLTIARTNNTITFSGSPTTIAVTDESIDVECYPLFSKDATGNIEPKTGSNIKFNSESGQLEAGSFKKTGGASSEFLKADGSVDSSTYSTFSGSYTDLTNKPTIPAAQVQSDWNATSGLGEILNKPTLFSGSYTDLTNKPTLFSGSYTDLTNKPTLVSTLNDLSNVDAVSNVSQGKILKYNGSSWEVADDNASGGGGGATTINNNADNRIITGSASANTLNAESSLQYDGNSLFFSDDKAIKFGSNLRMQMYTDGSINYIKSSTDGSGAFPIQIHSGSSEVINIDDGNTQIKTGLKDKDGDLGTAGQVLSSTGTQVDWVAQTAAYTDGDVDARLNTPSATSGEILSWTGTDYDWIAASGGSTPTLNDVLGAGNTSALAATVGDFQCANLTVTGTTTTVNSNTVEIGDNILVLNSDEAGTPSQNAGLEIERGTSTNVSLRWNETTDKWQYTNDGTNFSDIGSSTLPVASATVRGGIKLGTGLNITNTDVLNVVLGIGGLADVTLSGSTTTNHVLTWNGTAWVPQAAQDTNTQLSTEQVQDIVGAMVDGGTETRIGVTYDDSTGKLGFVVDDMNDSLNDTNTTYSISCVDGASSDEERIRLTAGGSGSGTDDIVLEAGTGLSIARSGDKITFTNTETSSYSLPVASATVRGGVKLGTGLNITGTDVLNVALAIGGLADVTISGSPTSGQVITWSGSAWTNGAAPGVPVGTICMYSGTSAPAGWALCDGGGGRPDLRNKFVVGAGSSYNSGSTGGYTDAIVVDHDHNTSVGNQSANHTHGDGNYNTNATGDHYHQQQGTGSGNTGSQSHNHYHTVSPSRPNTNAAGITTVNTTSGGGSHGHGFQTTNSHPQSNMSGIKTEGGDGGNINNTYIQSGGGSHNHTVDCTGITTGGVDTNHTHSFNFNVGGNTTYGSVGNHSHNVQGSSGSESANHSHNVNVGSEGSSGSGRNMPPYYALTYIIKT